MKSTIETKTNVSQVFALDWQVVDTEPINYKFSEGEEYHARWMDKEENYTDLQNRATQRREKQNETLAAMGWSDEEIEDAPDIFMSR